jgi:hypothetical protein
MAWWRHARGDMEQRMHVCTCVSVCMCKCKHTWVCRHDVTQPPSSPAPSLPPPPHHYTYTERTLYRSLTSWARGSALSAPPLASDHCAPTVSTLLATHASTQTRTPVCVTPVGSVGPMCVATPQSPPGHEHARLGQTQGGLAAGHQTCIWGSVSIVATTRVASPSVHTCTHATCDMRHATGHSVCVWYPQAQHQCKHDKDGAANHVCT